MAAPHANISARTGTSIDQVQAPSLLSLPPELRLYIYEYVLYDHYGTADPHALIGKSLSHPIIHTSQLIRTESLPIYSKALDIYLSRLSRFGDAIKTKMDDTFQRLYALLNVPRPRYDILHSLFRELEDQGKQRGAMEKIRQPQIVRVHSEKQRWKYWRPRYQAVVTSSKKRKR